MSSKSSRPRSIASQLVLLFTLASTLLLCCGFAILYAIVIRHAIEEDNEVLADKVAALRGNLLTAGNANVLRGELSNPRPGERVQYLVRVRPLDGEVEAETAGMADILPAAVFPAMKMDAPVHFRTRDKLFALTSTTVDAGGQTYLLQVAQDRSGDDEFIRGLGFLLAGLLALGIAASAFIAVNVARRGLRPLTEMTASLERTSAQHMDERVPAEGWPRELQPVALAFDQMMDRLENSFTRLSQFSADLAHELRTPIANLRGESEVALTRTRPPEEYREVIESSVAEYERLSGMIESLLFLARAEAANESLARTAFDGAAAIEKVVSYYEPLAEERNISINTSGGGEVHADPQLFSRALSNLIENALRFTPGGGTVSVALRKANGGVEVVVQDNGSGIEAEHLPRVFDRFYRADPSRTATGTGLGLSLVKSIMDLHGGSAGVESEPGRGTTVRLQFPSA